MKLYDFVQGRNNNFNLIRIIAAYAVLITHSFALAIGTSDAEPLRNTIGMTIGLIAVDVFFLISGFLVTDSLLKRQNIIDFVWARSLRIFPALFVMLLLSVIGLGLFFSTVSWSLYFTNPMTYKYFFKCLTLIGGVEYQLPGVFNNNPYMSAVNGSLWTMPYELEMYGILAFIWGFLSIVPIYRANIFKIMIIFSAFSVCLYIIIGRLTIAGEGSHFIRLFYMFFTGATFFMLKRQILISHSVFYLFIAVLLFSTINRNLFFIIYIVTLPYITFFIAYVPSGVIRKYNKLGDYSYGVYIYAFPIQQVTASLIPGITVLSMVAISSIFTLLFAILSWHWIEKYALALKYRSA